MVTAERADFSAPEPENPESAASVPAPTGGMGPSDDVALGTTIAGTGVNR
jgi:hypothetical protein